MVVLRNEFGGVLRDVRQQQGRTLRDVSRDARVSLGYLSEVERGQKEASSEMLSAICDALDTPLSEIMREVTDRIYIAEQANIPDTIPADFYQGLLSRSPHLALKSSATRYAPSLAAYARNSRELAAAR